MATTTVDRSLLIDGEHVETGDWTEVRSPYSGDVIGRVAKGGAAEARRALDAAAAAMETPLPAHERARILDTVAHLLEERSEEAARTISAEAGQAAQGGEGRGAARGIDVHVRRGRGAPARRRGRADGCIARRAGKLALTLRLPIGIVGAISPFNFPLNLVAHKIAPALAAGCAVVLKPATATPFSALFLAELEQEAGLPPGWLNVVSGPAAPIGDALVADERVKLITFTGSSGVGWSLAERAHRKRVKLELGNATPAIVCADAPATPRPSSRRTRSRSPDRVASRCSGSTCSPTAGTTSSPSSCRKSRR